MTLQYWCFSFKGRIGRRDFWIWQGVWLLAMAAIFALAGLGLLSMQSAAFVIVALQWPAAAVLVKRLHDRDKSGWWGLLLVLAWVLAAGNWLELPSLWQWGLGRFMPILITVMMLLDCGVFLGSPENNRFGTPPTPLRLKAVAAKD